MLQTAKIVIEPAGGTHNLSPGEYYFDAETNTIYLRRGGSSSVRLGPKTITANGVYYPAGDNLDGFNSVDVRVPGITPTGTIQITENGTHNVAQYANAEVNVSGGSGDTTKLVTGGTAGSHGDVYNFVKVANPNDGCPDLRAAFFQYTGIPYESLPNRYSEASPNPPITHLAPASFVDPSDTVIVPNSHASNMAYNRMYVLDLNTGAVDSTDAKKVWATGTCLIYIDARWEIHFFGKYVTIEGFDDTTIHGYKIDLGSPEVYIDGDYYEEDFYPTFMCYQVGGVDATPIINYTSKMLLKEV